MYGVDSTTTGSAVSFNLKLMYADTSSANDVIAETKSAITMTYDSAQQGSSLTLSELVVSTLN